MKIDSEKIQQKIQPVVNVFSKNIYIKAVSDGLASILPAIMVGAVFSLFSGLSITPYQNFITSTGIKKFLQIPVNFTTNILALLAVFFISYHLAELLKKSGLMAGLLGLINFLVLTPISSITVKGTTSDVIPFTWLGATGFFSAIIVALIGTRIYAWVMDKGFSIKMPDGVPPTISRSFSALIPDFIVVIFFIIIAALFSITPYGSMHVFIYKFVQLPLQNLGGSFGALIIGTLVMLILWWFGIHGGLVVMSVLVPIWTPMDTANMAAYAAGQKMPYIVCHAFLTTYASIGGAGATLGLVILMAFKAKSKRYSTLGKLSFLPGLFVINEPVIFGMPIVLNPLMAIPFIITPIVDETIAYICTLTGLVPPCMGATLTLPPFVLGIMQGSWKIGVLQLVLLFVSTLIYLPFFKMLDKQAFEEEKYNTVQNGTAD